MTGPNAAQILKCVASKQAATSADITEGPIKEVIFELLNTLVVKYNWKTEDQANSNSGEVRQPTSLGDALQEVVNEMARDLTERQSIVRQGSSTDLQQEDDPAISQPQTSTSSQDKEDGNEEKSAQDKAKEAKAKEEDEKKKRPLMPKSAIMRLLAEMVRSYTGCAQMVTQHSYHTGQSELVTEVRNIIYKSLCEGIGFF